MHTVAETAEILKKRLGKYGRPDSVRLLIRQGKLKAKPFGVRNSDWTKNNPRMYLITDEELERFMEENGD